MAEIAAVPPSSAAVAHTLPITAEEVAARVEYTQRAVASGVVGVELGWSCADFLAGDGPRLLDLAAIQTNQRTTETKTFLTLLLLRCHLDERDLLIAAIQSIERFGYDAPPYRVEATLCTLVQLVCDTPTHRSDELLPLQMRLCELLVAQSPSAPSDAALTDAVPWSLPLLDRHDERLLPMVFLLERHSPVTWHEWVSNLPQSISYKLVEFTLRFLLSSSDSTLGARAPESTFKALKGRLMPESDHDCTLSTQAYQLVLTIQMSAVKRTAAHHGVGSESASSPIAIVREWIQQQLTDLPVNHFCAKLRCQLGDTNDAVVFSAVAELIQALQQRPDSVRLDDGDFAASRLCAGSTLIGSILSLSRVHLLELASVADVLRTRVEAMEPSTMAPTAFSYPLPVDTLLHSHLLTLAADVSPGTSFDRLAASLLDRTLAGAAGRSILLGRAFSRLASSGSESAVPWRGVRRALQLLAERGIRVDDQGCDFAYHLNQLCLEGRDPRGWISVHIGTDRYEAMVDLDRAIHASDRAPSTALSALVVPGDIADQLDEWRKAHWPAIRADLETHLIPDLAAIVLGYLRL